MSLILNNNLDYLAPATERLNEEAIVSLLNSHTTQSLGQLIVLAKTQSTNSYLLNSCQQSGVVCIAEYQTKGRGRLGRQWVSPAGHNIYLSMSWSFAAELNDLTGLSLAIGLAVVRVLDDYGLDGLSLKWPNDVYCNGQKLAGILIDIVRTNDNDCLVVIGIGLNRWIDTDASELIDQQWIDLFSLMGTTMPSRNQLIAKIIDQLTQTITLFEQNGFASFCDEWNQWDYLSEQTITLNAGNQIIRGTACGANATGLLVIKDEQGQKNTYAIGEVQLERP